MSNVAVMRETLPDLTGRQLELIRKTVASDCNNDEFNLFIEVARRVHLDPFRRQILPLVFNKDRPDKRRMSIVTGIDGFRVIAARCADYRPDEDEADITYDPALKGPLNPLGIVKAKVTVWKMDRGGAWHPVKGAAYWDEFAPVRDEWAYDQEAGKRKPTGKQELDGGGNWPKMPRIMISKCAEAQALRKGWPESFSGLYDPAELDRAQAIDIDASEAVEQEREARRMLAIGSPSDLIVDWMDDAELARVPAGQFADRIVDFIGRNPPERVLQFRDRNRETMKEFWAKAPSDALEIKKQFEAIERAEPKTIEGSVAADADADEDAAFELKKRVGSCKTGSDLDRLSEDAGFQTALKALPADLRDDVINTARARRLAVNPLGAV